MYAVIDIGSNTIRLVIYKVEQGEIQQVLSSKNAAGLAGYVDADHRLGPEGIEKAIAVMSQFRRILDSIHVEAEKTFVFATASLRNISNTGEAVSLIQAACGLEITVLSGEEEALFDYSGALRTLDTESGILVDIGGGSTELVLFQGRQVISATSLPMGSLNLYNKFVQDLFPTERELDDIAEYALKQLQSVSLPAELPNTLCGVGGTCRASCKLDRSLFQDKTGTTEYPCKHIKKMLKRFRSDRKEFLAIAIKTIPDRLHTILPGLMILSVAADLFRTSRFICSPYGVREGYLLSKLEESYHA